MYKMKHMISQIKPGSTNESPFWHKIFNFDSFALQNLICSAYDFLCLDLHCIAFQIFFIFPHQILIGFQDSVKVM